MIAALAQSQLPDFSFRSDLLRSKSIAKFIGKLDGGGRLQKEDLIYRDVDLDDREFELPEVAFEFRGPMWLGARQLDLVRWPPRGSMRSSSPSRNMPSGMRARRRSGSPSPA